MRFTTAQFIFLLLGFQSCTSFLALRENCAPFPTHRCSSHRDTAEDRASADDVIQPESSHMNRLQFFQQSSLLMAPFLISSPSRAFDGGVGGLGKTKPSTGVVLVEGSAPIQNEQGLVSAEILSTQQTPVLVQFQTPWPLLPTTSGLEARDLRSSESAFVQVVSLNANQRSTWKESRKVFQEILMDSVLASQGKYGAYGTPIDVKVKPYNTETGIYSVTFTSYTPAMRESERQVWIRPQAVGKDQSTLVMLVVGTTRNAFASQERTFANILSSFVAVDAPETQLRRKPTPVPKSEEKNS